MKKLTITNLSESKVTMENVSFQKKSAILFQLVATTHPKGDKST